ncbi:MAG: maleylacetoacetate isomerase [Legionella sp.]|jgi:maleylacetoacetate isomerase
MKLYDYYRSTACYRVRIALNIKNIAYETIPVHLVRDGGEQKLPAYLAINPQSLVPSLEVDGAIITQSLAIINYLEEAFPEIPILPKDLIMKATIRSLALLIACDIHPLNNLRVLNQLKQEFQADESQITLWYHHWLKAGFDAFETILTKLERKGNFCFGTSPSLADICLIPQVYNAERFHFAMDDYPLINAINQQCLTLEAFKKASPE